jgi:hypothetical protein
MAKDVVGQGRWRSDQVATMRAADADRQQVADQLKSAVDEGRLSLHEYDERIAAAYASRTYAELLVLVEDLPTPGLTAKQVKAQAAVAARRSARRIPMALMILWTIWAAVVGANVVVWALVVSIEGSDGVYPWPVWVAGPTGIALFVATVGVQTIRSQRKR